MKQAAKPLAVFAANDQQALDVLESCESVGITVPEQVAIVGAENYLLAPDAMHTPISSVDTNLEMLGYRGAELLDHLMAGKKPPREPIRIPAAGVVVRKSSDILTIKHQGVANSLRFIWEHGHEPICIKDLVRVAAMSRRGLHKAFLEHLGRTPGQELQRVRIERAKKLLAEIQPENRDRRPQCAAIKASTVFASPSNAPPACPPKVFAKKCGVNFKLFLPQTSAVDDDSNLAATKLFCHLTLSAHNLPARSQ